MSLIVCKVMIDGRISPISASQLYQLAANRDSDPPLAATSWPAPPPRTSTPVHSLWRALRHGTSCRPGFRKTRGF